MITSHISNLSLFENNKQCILHASDDKGYWWGTIKDDIEIMNVHDAHSYLKLNVILDKGPFKIKNTTPIFSNEEAPCIINGVVYPDLPIIRELISEVIRLKSEKEQIRSQTLDYKYMYNNIIDKLTHKGKI